VSLYKDHQGTIAIGTTGGRKVTALLRSQIYEPRAETVHHRQLVDGVMLSRRLHVLVDVTHTADAPFAIGTRNRIDSLRRKDNVLATTFQTIREKSKLVGTDEFDIRNGGNFPDSECFVNYGLSNQPPESSPIMAIGLRYQAMSADVSRWWYGRNSGETRVVGKRAIFVDDSLIWPVTPKIAAEARQLGADGQTLVKAATALQLALIKYGLPCSGAERSS
jgi:hypothetical protein